MVVNEITFFIEKFFMDDPKLLDKNFYEACAKIRNKLEIASPGLRYDALFQITYQQVFRNVWNKLFKERMCQDVL